jgi:prevent-host-death family protein
MERVGARKLKDHLAHYLRTVRQGETVVVTLRGKPVARLVPISGRDDKALRPEVEDKMWKLAAKGVLTWSGAPFQLPETVAENRGRKLLSDLVVEDRE